MFWWLGGTKKTCFYHVSKYNSSTVLGINNWTMQNLVTKKGIWSDKLSLGPNLRL